MENFFSRYKNPLVLMLILFVQVVALATQVKRPEKGAAASGGTRLIRVWTVTAISPFERALVSTGSFFRRNFHNYIDLHNVRKQNRELQDEVAQLKLEQVRLRQDAEQARRLQALLGFTQHYVGQLVPAQVIGTSGTEQSHMIQIDKGSRNGIKVDMPVITPDGIVGKVKDVFPFTSQVLMISDRESGAGVILQNSRLQGILRGSPQGELHVSDIMSDEKIDVGEEVVTSGGDRIYPKGLPVGSVAHVSPDRENDPFLAIRVKPAADLNRLEEVLVVTKIAEELPRSEPAGNVRAADILSERLPSVPKVDETKKAGAGKTGASSSPSPAAQSGTVTQKKPAVSAEPNKSPSPSVKAGEAATKKTEGKPPASASPGATAGAAAPAPASGQPSPGKTPPVATGAASEKKAGSSGPALAKTPLPTGSPNPSVTPAATPRQISDSPSPTPKKSPAPGGATQKKMATPGASPSGAPPSSTPGGAGTPKPKPSGTPVKKPTPAATPAASATPEQTTNLGSGSAKPGSDGEGRPR